LPVITLTTTDDPREVKGCYELGCGSYVTKPVEYDRFVEGRLIGVTALFARRPLPPDTLDALGSVADTIAQGIERKRAEERLREQAVLLDKATDATLVLDPEDRVVYWNRGAERIYGWSAAEAVGSPVEALHCRGHLAQRQEALGTSRAGASREVSRRGTEAPPAAVAERRCLPSAGCGPTPRRWRTGAGPAGRVCRVGGPCHHGPPP
jgi:PAS domain S-box-containing protein